MHCPHAAPAARGKGNMKPLAPAGETGDSPSPSPEHAGTACFRPPTLRPALGLPTAWTPVIKNVAFEVWPPCALSSKAEQEQHPVLP